MYVQPKDSRQRYTKQCLEDAFIQALSKKPVSAISVREICAVAGVSRKTFYKYYSDQFAFLFALQDDLFIGFVTELQTMPPNVFAITPAVITFVERHRVLARAAFEQRLPGGFIDQVLQYLYDTYQQDWQQANPLMSDRQVLYLFHYIVSGLLGVIQYWICSDIELSAEERIDQAEYLMRLSTP
jgi:AcrR family transcriptional regulator